MCYRILGFCLSNIPLELLNSSYLNFLYYFKPFLMEKRRDSEARRLQREKDERITYHHILNKCRKDLFSNLYDWENITELKWWIHRRRHDAHWNEHPLETLRNVNWITQVMSDKAALLYNALISLNEEEFYKTKFKKT